MSRSTPERRCIDFCSASLALIAVLLQAWSVVHSTVHEIAEPELVCEGESCAAHLGAEPGRAGPPEAALDASSRGPAVETIPGPCPAAHEHACACAFCCTGVRAVNRSDGSFSVSLALTLRPGVRGAERETRWTSDDAFRRPFPRGPPPPSPTRPA